MKSYRVNEIFYSLQGEGGRAGEASIFVRFSGCNLTCSEAVEGFDCDTEFTSGVSMTAEEIIAACTRAAPHCEWIVWTGGEPSLQLDADLVSAVIEAGYWQAIETNGTRELPVGLDYICVSPKTGEHTLKVSDAQEVKYVRNAGQGIPKPTIKAERRYLSPAFHPDGTVDRSSLQHCIELCKLFPSWRLSCQQHKWWRVR